PQLQQLLAADTDDLRFELSIHLPCEDALPELPPFARLDHLRLGGPNAAFRSICVEDSVATENPSADLFGFENLSLWSSNQVTLAADTSNYRQGAQAASAPGVTQTLTSVPFSLGSAARERLLLDVFVPAVTNGATVSLNLDCASVAVDETDSHVV